MIAIPWEVQISVCGLPVYPYGEGSIWFWCYDGVQKGDGTIIIGFLNSKLDGRIPCVDVTEELFFVWLMLYHKGIINIPLPHPRAVHCCWDGSVFKGFHIDVGHYWTYWWPHGSSFCLFIKHLLEKEVDIIQAELQQLYDIVSCHFGSI